MNGGSLDAAHRFDLAMQRAVGVGLGIAVVQGVVTAGLGAALYPPWWWWTVGPAALALGATAVLQGMAGRFERHARTALATGVALAAVLTSVATGSAVRDAGTALLPVVLLTIVGIGFLESPERAAVLGGAVIAANTVVPGILRPPELPVLLTQTAIQALILVATAIGGRAARRIVADEERALDELADAITADRAAAAARAERRELEREMHDTVLNTLSAIGRSSLPDSAAVRRRCAADARFLRTLRDPDPAGSNLLDQLRSLTGPLAEDGFAVALPLECPPHGDVPLAVVVAVVRASREALNNAREHSGADGAHVDIAVDAGRLTVVVSDRGSGGGRGADEQRLGIRRSLAERMDDVGGSATVRRVPGVGTTVTLRWPR